MKLCIKVTVFNFSPFSPSYAPFYTFAEFKGFPLFLLHFLQNLIHGPGIRKERIHVFQIFLEGFRV